MTCTFTEDFKAGCSIAVEIRSLSEVEVTRVFTEESPGNAGHHAS